MRDELRYHLGDIFIRDARNVGAGDLMAFYAFYAVAIVILILHFTGWLARRNLEWVVLVLAVAVFPAVIFLK